MSLPKQKHPLYSLTIPSTKKKVSFRPFIVKEEKALLIAEQSEDFSVIVDTLKSVIDSCTMNKVDMDKLAVFDLEYMLLMIRSKSVGEIVELTVPCSSCEKPILLNMDLTGIEVFFPPEHSNKILLWDNIGVMMKYPKIDILNSLLASDNEVDVVYNATIECIDYIFEGETIHYTKEQTQEELHEFLDNLNELQFAKFNQFFDTMPHIRKSMDYTCPHCGTENHQVLEGIKNFLG